jgi:gas vesicle protein
MNNPFEKKDNTALIVSVAIGSIAAGAATWLFMTERGSVVRDQISTQLDKLSALFKNKAVEEVTEEHAPQYTHRKAKAPKTDREALHKDEILHEPNTGAATATE